ncbi:MAG: ABC transporter ATP-binding protein [Candidatus Bathyarchaeota archaeon]|nr:MAG: ABC transporter ATP-binding protein [Candidatus Bathyarchaeota archaeon]
MVSVKLVNVIKRFGEVIAADHVNLNIKDGEFFTLLGPSGCGKTTTLRIIAGFYHPDNGSVFFDDEDVTNLQPEKRQTGMVFQNYALWPHMKVSENVAYGLKVRKISRNEIKERVTRILDLVQLQGMENRTPFQLSGGQQQRVALARALVIEPKVLLLDEPLSNLDAKLRLEMRREIIQIQKKLGITTIYVTHDQEEALSVSDRIAIQHHGSIQQVASPKEIYDRPKNAFIADFIGQCNFFPGTIEKVNKYVTVATDVEERLRTLKYDDVKIGDRVICVVRPENFSLNKPTKEFNVVECEITSVIFIGKSNRIYGKIGDMTVLAEIPTDVTVEPGERLSLYASIDETTVLPITS